MKSLNRLSYVLAFIGDAPSSTRKKHLKDQTDNLLSYYQSSLANSDSQQPVSSQRPAQHTRQLSSTSTSSSDYSNDSESEVATDARGFVSEASAGIGRRSNAPTKGGADRRRMAIVQMDTVSQTAQHSSTSNKNPSSLRQRRGHQSSLSGLALVAPPDASLCSYTQITPPPTALTHQHKSHHRAASEITTSNYGSSRDTATVSTARTSQDEYSRNISNKTSATKKSNVKNIYHLPHSQSSSAFQSPSSRSSSPSNTPKSNHSFLGILSPPDTALPPRSGPSSHSPMLTPGTGEGNLPAVVNLASTKPVSSRSGTPASLKSDSATAALYAATSETPTYQTADSMPPPRAMFNIDTNSPPPPRPPRLYSPAPNRRGDIESVKQPLVLPSLPSPALDSTSPNLASNRSHSLERRLKHGIHEKDSSENDSHILGSINGGTQLQHSRSIHRREGAFPPSSNDNISVETASSTASYDRDLGKLSEEPDRDPKLTPSTTPDNDEVPTMTVIEPAPPLANNSDQSKGDQADRSKFDQWLLDNAYLIQQPQEIRRGVSLDEQRAFASERPTSPLSADHHSHHSDVPSPPPKSFRNSLTTNLKRFSSLPRAPSLSSRSAHRSSGSTRYSSRTPSPSAAPHQRGSTHPPFKKIRSTNPAALFCHEVYSQTTTLQRCAIYTAKINELYLHDCGLSDWLVEMNTRGTRQTTRARGPSGMPFSPQPRHSSRSSMVSEATFPRRPDAYMATDLSQGSTPEINPAIPPATLPYPSLALNPPRNHPARSNSSVGHNTPPSSVRSLAPISAPATKASGFFASLGRRASTSKKDRPVIAFPLNHSTTNNVVSGPMSAGPGIGRTISKTTISSGITSISRPLNIHGPHASPGGPRAPPNRVQRSQTFMTPVTHTYGYQRDDALARRPSLFDLSNDVIDIRPDPEFNRQVDRLMLLLPNADRDVLSGYLRRAGTDMLAIGQYLADEKNGTIRYPHD
ncbi:hypothetical protein CVT24_002036 [Panaeolus cyanescens]|uniref:Uncharacterized protein n=1 Tax=Panaeolus cyanescens TaxID=181874 RepID=A0A409YHI7_9AGAR|nr:hypothetical protein CVT24_002036 [Panaeolus cyanescens]